MDGLKNFASKNFIEQVEILQDIENKKSDEAIPWLVELCENSDPFDQAVFIAENTLRSLLLENQEQTVKGLMSDNVNIKKVSLQVCCRKKYPLATPALIKLSSDLVSEQSPALIPGQADYNEGLDILSALALIQPPEAVEIFRQYLHHSDSIIASLSIEAIGKYKDVDSVDALCNIVDAAEADDRYEECDLPVASAIDALAMINTDKAISFLASKIHHRNPAARRIIHEVFPRLGPETIPFIKPFLFQDDTDLKIMAVTILGNIGDKTGVDVIIDAVDKAMTNHPNVKFAVYEALGQIPSDKGLAQLTNGLFEQNPSMLMAVIASLNDQFNPNTAETLKNLIQKGDDHAFRLINAVVASRALSLFEFLYEDQIIGNQMIESIIKSNDKGLCGLLSKKLKLMAGDRAESDADKIKSFSSGQLKKRVLIVDDSKSILAFYRNAVSAMGFLSITAENGQQALDILEQDNGFNLILTDINMPIMTGIELTQEIREDSSMDKIPIIVASTESAHSQVQLAQKMGADDFINKPFTAEQLQDKIRTFI